MVGLPRPESKWSSTPGQGLRRRRSCGARHCDEDDVTAGKGLRKGPQVMSPDQLPSAALGRVLSPSLQDYCNWRKTVLERKAKHHTVATPEGDRQLQAALEFGSTAASKLASNQASLLLLVYCHSPYYHDHSPSAPPKHSPPHHVYFTIRYVYCTCLLQ